MNLGGSELVIILAIAMLVFGGKKIPELARSMGAAKREFEAGQREGRPTPDEDDDTTA